MPGLFAGFSLLRSDVRTALRWWPALSRADLASCEKTSSADGDVPAPSSGAVATELDPRLRPLAQA